MTVFRKNVWRQRKNYIPANVIAVGNPCRVVREITEEDRDYYFRDRKFDVDDYIPEK